jgi:hypothetical protein
MVRHISAQSAETWRTDKGTRLHYLEVGRDELWARLSRRNVHLPPGTFVVTEDQLDLWWSWFQPPTADELSALGQ